MKMLSVVLKRSFLHLFKFQLWIPAIVAMVAELYVNYLEGGNSLTGLVLVILKGSYHSLIGFFFTFLLILFLAVSLIKYGKISFRKVSQEYENNLLSLIAVSVVWSIFLGVHHYVLAGFLLSLTAPNSPMPFFFGALLLGTIILMALNFFAYAAVVYDKLGARNAFQASTKVAKKYFTSALVIAFIYTFLLFGGTLLERFIFPLSLLGKINGWIAVGIFGFYKVFFVLFSVLVPLHFYAEARKTVEIEASLDIPDEELLNPEKA